MDKAFVFMQVLYPFGFLMQSCLSMLRDQMLNEKKETKCLVGQDKLALNHCDQEDKSESKMCSLNREVVLSVSASES